MSEAVKILDDTNCELGEGPFFCERRDTLFWFDIVGRKRHAFCFSTNEKTELTLPEMASAMAVVDDKTDLIFTESGLWKLDVDTSAWTPIASIEADNDVTRSNDARVHPSGAFWLGTMGRSAEPNAGSIYHFLRGKLTKLFDDITIPNAICFAPDAKTAYFTDTITARLMAVDVDPGTGLPSAAPRVLVDHTELDSGLDGAVVDLEGNIWIALWGAAKLNCFAPDGTLISSTSIAAKQPTCPAFIGNGKIAVTTAWQGMSPQDRFDDPNAGMTFVVDCGAKPKYEPRVII